MSLFSKLGAGAAGLAGVAVVGAAAGVVLLGGSGATTASADTSADLTSASVASLGDASLASQVLAAGSLEGSTLADADPANIQWQRLCVRVPVALQRVENVEKRLAADANTKGSIAYLQARIAKAQAAGNTDAVTILQGRLVVRQDLQKILPDRIKQLQEAQSLCAKHTTSGSTPAPSGSAA